MRERPITLPHHREQTFRPWSAAVERLILTERCPRAATSGAWHPDVYGLAMVEKVALAEKFGAFEEHWSPKIVAELNDSYVKVVKLEGEFVWHARDNEGAVPGGFRAPTRSSCATAT